MVCFRIGVYVWFGAGSEMGGLCKEIRQIDMIKQKPENIFIFNLTIMGDVKKSGCFEWCTDIYNDII